LSAFAGFLRMKSDLYLVIKYFFHSDCLRLPVSLCGTLATLLISVLPAPAQDTGESEKVRGSSFSCMYWDGTPPEELFYKDGKSFLPIKFYHSKRSERYKLKTEEIFTLYRKLPEVKEGEEPYAPVARAPVKKGATCVLFLVFKTETEPAFKARIMSVDDSLAAFPSGTFRFVNFSNQPLIVKFDDTVKQLSPGKVELMKFRMPEDGGYLPFLIGNADGKSIYENRLFAQPGGRKMVFIIPPALPDGLPQVRFLDEIIVPEPQD
jgi:hypothetical protein